MSTSSLDVLLVLACGVAEYGGGAVPAGAVGAGFAGSAAACWVGA